MWAAALGDLFILGIYENRQGTCQSPDNPWAGCLTEILSYGVAFEKFSWCFRSEDFCINISADLHGCPMSLRLFMLLVFLYGSDLHLKLTNLTYFIVLHASAVSHTTGPSTPRLWRARGNASFRQGKLPRFSRQRNSLKQLASITSCLPQPGVAKQGGGLRGSFGLRNFEMLPLRVFIFYKIHLPCFTKQKLYLLYMRLNS